MYTVSDCISCLCGAILAGAIIIVCVHNAVPWAQYEQFSCLRVRWVSQRVRRARPRLARKLARLLLTAAIDTLCRPLLRPVGDQRALLRSSSSVVSRDKTEDDVETEWSCLVHDARSLTPALRRACPVINTLSNGHTEGIGRCTCRTRQSTWRSVCSRLFMQFRSVSPRFHSLHNNTPPRRSTSDNSYIQSKLNRSIVIGCIVVR